jgi:hypothetical protein
MGYHNTQNQNPDYYYPQQQIQQQYQGNNYQNNYQGNRNNYPRNSNYQGNNYNNNYAYNRNLQNLNPNYQKQNNRNYYQYQNENYERENDEKHNSDNSNKKNDNFDKKKINSDDNSGSSSSSSNQQVEDVTLGIEKGTVDESPESADGVVSTTSTIPISENEKIEKIQNIEKIDPVGKGKKIDENGDKPNDLKKKEADKVNVETKENVVSILDQVTNMPIETLKTTQVSTHSSSDNELEGSLVVLSKDPKGDDTQKKPRVRNHDRKDQGDYKGDHKDKEGISRDRDKDGRDRQSRYGHVFIDVYVWLYVNLFMHNYTEGIYGREG